MEEKRRRQQKASPAAASLADAAFPQQRSFIEDPASFKAAICSRRAGKSYGIGLYLFLEALAHPGCSCLYLVETNKQARRSMWRQVMHAIDRQYRLGAVFNETEMTITLPNESVIYLMGMDTSVQQQESIRGSHYRLIVVDEAGSFRNDLRTLVQEVLEPAVLDDMGTICLIGTPRAVKNLFYDVVERKEPGWSVHRWMVHDNPHTRDEFEHARRRSETTYGPEYFKTTRWRQEWLAEWVLDDEQMVYRYKEERNTAQGLPEGERWHHIIGLDPGFKDAAAWVVCAYNLHDSTLYVREIKKQPGLDVSQMASFTRHLVDTYDPHAVVIDSAAAQTAEELRQRYDLPIEASDKTGPKYEAIQMLNSDLLTGRIKLLPGTEELAKEWSELAWDERALKNYRYAEDPRCDNHLADAMLYAWRRCRNYRPEAKAVEPRPGSNEALDLWWEQQGQLLTRDPELELWDI